MTSKGHDYKCRREHAIVSDRIHMHGRFGLSTQRKLYARVSRKKQMKTVRSIDLLKIRLEQKRNSQERSCGNCTWFRVANLPHKFQKVHGSCGVVWIQIVRLTFQTASRWSNYSGICPFRKFWYQHDMPYCLNIMRKALKKRVMFNYRSQPVS